MTIAELVSAIVKHEGINGVVHKKTVFCFISILSDMIYADNQQVISRMLYTNGKHRKYSKKLSDSKKELKKLFEPTIK